MSRIWIDSIWLTCFAKREKKIMETKCSCMFMRATKWKHWFAWRGWWDEVREIDLQILRNVIWARNYEIIQSLEPLRYKAHLLNCQGAIT